MCPKEQMMLYMLKEDKFSDLIFECQDVKFKVHCGVVTFMSPMLKAALQGPFLESTTRLFPFNDDHPAILARVIYFMYTSTYCPYSVPEIFQEVCSDTDDLELYPPEMDCDVTVVNDSEGSNGDDAKDGAKDDGVDASSAKDTGSENDTAKEKPARLTEAEAWASHYSSKKEKMIKAVKAAMVSAHVYKTADYLGMVDLKTEAAEHFLTCLKKWYSFEEFKEPLQIMFENTVENDKILRFETTKFLLEHRSPVKGTVQKIRPQVVNVIRDHTAGLWDIITEQLDVYKDQKQEETKEQAKFIVELLGKRNLRCQHQRNVTISLNDRVTKNNKYLGVKFTTTCGRCP